MLNIVPLLGEFLGAFLFLLTILFTGNWAAIGAALAVLIYILGPISGGHVNPAVSLAMYVKGSLGGAEFLAYTVSQLFGAVAAVYTYRSVA
jgi:aquaporin Z